MFGCEVWGSVSTDAIETVQASFAKYVLGVRQKVPNIGAEAELGMLPISKFKIFRIVKYWLRIVLDKPSVLFRSYLLLKTVRGKTWCTFVKTSLERYGFGTVWINERVEEPDNFLLVLLQRIRDTNLQDFEASARGMSRLRLLTDIGNKPLGDYGELGRKALTLTLTFTLTLSIV